MIHHSSPSSCSSIIDALPKNAKSLLLSQVIGPITIVGFLALVSLCQAASAQTNEWEWMKGNEPSMCLPMSYGGCTGVGELGVYGTLGVPAAGNTPGGRSSPVTWTDKNDNLWLFSGDGFDSAGNNAFLNDLWEYSPSNNEWAWMGGSSTIGSAGGWSGVYGTLGVLAAANIPGSRSGAVSWTDGSGNFWLFGGQGQDSVGNTGNLNDLWMFNLSTKEWAWMGGSSTVTPGLGLPGVYGNLGIAAIGNIPGGREMATGWIDSSGNFWLFGGTGIDSEYRNGTLNDLWKFNPSNKEWAWMAGSKTQLGDGGQGVYGTLGVPAAGNTPASRSGAVGWTDKIGNFWLFGGHGVGSPGGAGSFNDLWEFNPALGTNGEWAWIGPPSNQGFPVYGALGVAAVENFPGARYLPVSWTDSKGNLWLFGGTGTDATDEVGYLNDLWQFNPSTNEWTWMGGSSKVDTSEDAPGVYGTVGVAAATDIPIGRRSSVGWTDSAGNFWLFGGSDIAAFNQNSFYELNDLWRYQPPLSTSPATARPTFSVGPGNYTTTQSVTISDATAGATIYYSTNATEPGVAPVWTIYSGALAVSSSETISAVAIANDYSFSPVASATYSLNFPTFTLLLTGSASLYASSGGQTTTTLAILPQNGFSSPVTFACSGLPSGASCAFSPATVTPSLYGSTATLTITGETLALNSKSSPLFSGTVVAFSLCIFGWRKRRGLKLVLLIAVAAGGMALLSGCGGGAGGSGTGGGGGGSSSVTPVASTITITATSGSLMQTTTVSLIVD
ncbi:MAG: kelch repeat-containing protein [Terracidiphilus sp.]